MFQLVFRGECVPGTDPATARSNAKALFKASVEQVDRMFSGQPVVIRNRLEEQQAEKYRGVLRKHGMVAHVQPMEGTSQPAPRPTPDAAPRDRTAVQAGTRKVEPEKSLPERHPQSAESSPTVAVEPGDRLPVAGDKVDSILSGSGLGLDPVGVTLEEHKDTPAPMFQHLQDWTLAPPGSELGAKREVPPPVVPDVSHLSLADEDRRDKQ